MIDKLVVVALGDKNSGKSTTWHNLFETIVNSGKKERPLYFSEGEYTYVYLINGSPQERKTPVSKILQCKTPNIVLCSIQYVEDAKETIDYFIEHEYYFFVHWLNPGFHQKSEVADTLELKSYILNNNRSQFFIRNGQEDLEGRTAEIKKFLYNWATDQKLLYFQKNK